MYTILVCDDERDIVSALEIYLTAEGYRVLKAYNGKEARAIAVPSRFMRKLVCRLRLNEVSRQ